MLRAIVLALASFCACATVGAQQAKDFDAASAFGARESLVDLSLSPDGSSVAYVAPAAGQGSVVYTLSLAKGSKPLAALGADGKPFRIEGCNWVSNKRLVCTVYGVVRDVNVGLLPLWRLVAIDSDGSNQRILSVQHNEYSSGFDLYSGEIIDWLPDADGYVLMARPHLPNAQLGAHLESDSKGMGVDRVDTRTLAASQVEAPRKDAFRYLTDGRGVVRIMGIQHTRDGFQATGSHTYLYRLVGSDRWQKLCDYNTVDRSGFRPIAVDHDLNVVYGFKKLDGRTALYTMALDGSLQEQLVYARPDVDMDGLFRVGRRRRVVGVSFVTDRLHTKFFAPGFEQLATAIHKALPSQTMLLLIETSVDESKLLYHASADSDPGVYYLFDRKTSHLDTFMVSRSQLEGVKLATVKPISYPGPDGVMIPAYLTLPPGREDAKGLPAIVMPHEGTAARAEWGFDWLSQFYAARGYAVLRPNFRGSAGYGDAWFKANGFKSWPVAIGDIRAAGHWLVSQGLADPAKLAIVGWSYGGYAALQSAAIEPELFKAAVAIAPMTDLNAFKEEHRNWSDYELISNFVGDGPHLREGSPLDLADKISVPVLLFHGAMDRTVGIDESRRMAARLGSRCELVTWDDLDHSLDDSAARTLMLQKSDAFLRKAFGM
jgi:dipeptidyl aminopeptidase/acylaminoacyl peptidase